MKYESLKEFEKKIGAFTKANLNETYKYWEHGIILGEVGFPTELAKNGFTFFGLCSNPNWVDSFVDYL